MASILNSSIQLWFDYTGDILPVILPCQRIEWVSARPNIVLDANCKHVCNDSSSILDPTMPNNLATCGLWSSLTLMPSTTMGDPDERSLNNRVIALLEQFVLLGLDRRDANYAADVRDTVASCLSFLYNQIMSVTYMGIASFASACAEQELFTYFRLAYRDAQIPTSSFRDCIDAICSPRTLNPDPGGIGVSLSDFAILYPRAIL